jgi:hypothetical protein
MKTTLYECTIPPWMIPNKDKDRRDQPVQVPLELPLEEPPPYWPPPTPENDEEGERGVVIIDIGGGGDDEEEDGDNNRGVGRIDINKGGFRFV